jgi:hypothetical protein
MQKRNSSVNKFAFRNLHLSCQTIFLIINSVGYFLNLYFNMYNTLESPFIYLSIDRVSIIKYY